jgi:hypothetical protein
MKKILQSGFLLGALFLSSCEAETSVSLPDEFWAHGTWRYDADEMVYTVANRGTAIIDLHFTRQQGEQYLIDGTLTYDETTLGCDVFFLGHKPICTEDTCEFVDLVPGELTGVAEARDGLLVMQMNWLTKPDELYSWICTPENSSTQSSWSVWMTMGPLGAGIVEETWELDIEDAVFVDDLPEGEISDAKVMSANFDVVANDVAAQGLIGFYRNKP